MSSKPEKRYLGDSVYAAFDGYHVVLTTENGHGPTNTIALEPAVLDAVNNYVEYVRRFYAERYAADTIADPDDDTPDPEGDIERAQMIIGDRR